VNNAESPGSSPPPAEIHAQVWQTVPPAYGSNLTHDGYPLITSVLLWRRYSHKQVSET